jgi:hypothetical protein
MTVARQGGLDQAAQSPDLAITETGDAKLATRSSLAPLCKGIPLPLQLLLKKVRKNHTNPLRFEYFTLTHLD